MAENKVISIDLDETGLTIYCIIKRNADDFIFDDDDGTFKNSGWVDKYVNMAAESAPYAKRYSNTEARAVWNDGRYDILIKEQVGGSPSDANDEVIGGGEMAIEEDVEITLGLEAKTAELSTIPAAGTPVSMFTKLRIIFQYFKFFRWITGTTETMKKANGTSDLASATVSEDSTFKRGDMKS